jgi:hypothetical protein
MSWCKSRKWDNQDMEILAKWKENTCFLAQAQQTMHLLELKSEKIFEPKFNEQLAFEPDFSFPKLEWLPLEV